MVLDHVFDRQLLCCNQPKLGNQVSADLVNEVFSPVRNFDMNLLQLLFGFASLLGALLLSCQAASGSSQLRQGLFEKPWVVNLLAFGSRQEMVQAHVDPDMRLAIEDERLLAQVASQDDIPMTSFPLNTDGLDFAFLVPMLPDSNWFFKPMQPKLVALESDAVPIGRKQDRVPAVRPFESGITRPLSCLDPLEERFEGFVKPSKRCLSRTEVEGLEAGVLGSELFEPSRLLGIRDSFLVFGPRGAAFGEGFVVEEAMGVQELAEGQLLLVGWVEAELVSLEHDNDLPMDIIHRKMGFNLGKGVCANSSAA